MSLRLDWCGNDAAKYACEKWHYSRCVPKGKTAKIGVWEDSRFIGVVIFAQGSNPQIGRPFGLSMFQVCELCRIALKDHKSSVTKIVSIAIKMLRDKFRGLKLIVSYSDLDQGHTGVIYQAGNWVYCGIFGNSSKIYMVNNKPVHGRTIFHKYGTRKIEEIKKIIPSLRMVDSQGKHKYLMPLEKNLAINLRKKALPYPKRAVSVEGDTTINQMEEGGSIPTTALLGVE